MYYSAIGAEREGSEEPPHAQSHRACSTTETSQYARQSSRSPRSLRCCSPSRNILRRGISHFVRRPGHDSTDCCSGDCAVGACEVDNFRGAGGVPMRLSMWCSSPRPIARVAGKSTLANTSAPSAQPAKPQEGSTPAARATPAPVAPPVRNRMSPMACKVDAGESATGRSIQPHRLSPTRQVAPRVTPSSTVRPPTSTAPPWTPTPAPGSVCRRFREAQGLRLGPLLAAPEGAARPEDQRPTRCRDSSRVGSPGPQPAGLPTIKDTRPRRQDARPDGKEPSAWGCGRLLLVLLPNHPEETVEGGVELDYRSARLERAVRDEPVTWKRPQAPDRAIFSEWGRRPSSRCAVRLQ